MLAAALPALAVCVAGSAPGAQGDVGRPTLSGPELTHDSADGLFKVHYTLSGADALAVAEDLDPANGVPDSVDWIEEGAGIVYHAFVDEDGWPEPPADEGVGGDGRIDIYVRALDINGYTHYVTLPSGHKASYIEIAPGNARLSKATFESIAGHETHHVLQFGMSDELPSWIYEATATYAQYLLFDDGLLTIARDALWIIRLGDPEFALDAVGNRYEYAGMVWVKYLIDKGTRDRKKLLYLWSAMAYAHDWVKGHDDFAVADLGLAGLDAAVEDYAVWNWFACASSDGRHYDPSNLGCLAGSVSRIEITAFPADGTTVTIGERGSAYLRFDPECKSRELDLTLRPTGKVRFQVIEEVPQDVSPILPDDGASASEKHFAISGWNDFHHVALVATNESGAPVTVSYHAETTGTYAPSASLPKPAALTAAPDLTRLAVGERAPVQLSASFGSCADGLDIAARATWSSSDPSVATVQNGEIVATRRGTADLFATFDGVGSNHVAVMVSPAPDSGSCQIGNSPPSSLPALAWVLAAWSALSLFRRKSL